MWTVCVSSVDAMAIPLAYNLRNLAVRKGTTLMTALGITLTVSVLLSVLALVGGLRTAFQATGHPLQILVMRKGSTAELTSVVSRTAFQDLKYKPGIARLPDGDKYPTGPVAAGGCGRVAGVAISVRRLVVSGATASRGRKKHASFPLAPAPATCPAPPK